MKFAIVLVVLVAVQTLASPVLDESTLQQLIVVTRHGARTPYSNLPIAHPETWECELSELEISDLGSSGEYSPPGRLYRKTYIPGRQTLPGNCSQGELTKVGAAEHLKLGAAYRQKYASFLPQAYNKGEVYVRSTDVQRTRKSAENFLLGMFPTSGHNSCPAQVIDLNLLEKGVETMYPNAQRCPALPSLCEAVTKTSAWALRDKAFEPAAAALAKAFNTSQVPWLVGVYGSFMARQYEGVPLPPGVNQTLLEDLIKMVSWQIRAIYSTPDVYQLAIGEFVQQLQTRQSDLINASPDAKKFLLFSGHDLTLGLLLSAFDIWPAANNTWPHFASHMSLELHKANGENYVRIIFNDQLASIPACSDGTQCTWSEWTSLVRSVAPPNWKERCQVTGSGSLESLMTRLFHDRFQLRFDDAELLALESNNDMYGSLMC